MRICIPLSILVISLFLFSCSAESTPVYTLTTTASPAEGGVITPNVGSYDERDVVCLQATPEEEWLFAKWEQDLNTMANPLNIIMTQDWEALLLKKNKKEVI